MSDDRDDLLDREDEPREDEGPDRELDPPYPGIDEMSGDEDRL